MNEIGRESVGNSARRGAVEEAPPPVVAAPEPEMPPAAALGSPQVAWKAVIADLRAQKREMLASALAHGRVLALGPGQVRLGFAAHDAMFRRQVERAQKDAEAVIAKVLGAPTRLTLETVTAAEAPSPSLAEEETERARAREERIVRQSREHPAVLMAMRLFGGAVEQIRVLDQEQDEDFTAPPEEADDAGHDEA